MKNQLKSGIILTAILFLIVVGAMSSDAPINAKPSTINYVLKGKNNWLFYKNTSDGVTIPEYKGIHYSKKTLKQIADNLIKMKKAVEKKGAKFVVMIAPCKEVIYSEYMPQNIKRQSTKTRADQLAKYLNKNTDITVVYPKKDILAAKEEHLLYYKTDTHWNEKGRFLAVQELRHQLLGVEKTSIDEVEFKVKETGYAGDLARFLGQASSYKIDEKYSAKIKIPKKEKSDKDIILVGDSFGRELSSLTKKYFKSYQFFSIWQWQMSKISESTDVVIWEGAERYIDRFLYMKPYNK